jgi:ketosteroid isomerase-like protein
MAKEDIERLERAYKSFNTNDREAIYEWLDPEIEWVNPPDSPDHGVWHGHDGVATWIHDFLDPQFETARFEPEEYIDLGDRVLVLCRAVVIPHGGTVEMNAPFAHLVTMRDGLATKLQMFSDRAQAMEAAGLDL